MTIKAFDKNSKRETVLREIDTTLKERIWYRLRNCLSRTLTIESAADTKGLYPDAEMHEMLSKGWLPAPAPATEDSVIAPYSLSEWADHIQYWNDVLENHEPSDFFDEEAGCGALDLYRMQEIVNCAALSAARFYASACCAGASQDCLKRCREDFRRGVKALLCGNIGWTLTAEYGESIDEGVEPRIAEALMLSARLHAGAPMNELYLFAGLQNPDGTLNNRMVDDRYQHPPISITAESQPAAALRAMDEAMDIVVEELYAAGYPKHAVRMMILRNAEKIDTKSAPFINFVYSILEKPPSERIQQENRDAFNLCATTLSSFNFGNVESIRQDALSRFAKAYPKMKKGMDSVATLFSGFSEQDTLGRGLKVVSDKAVALISICAAFSRTEENEVFLDSSLFEKTLFIDKMANRDCTPADIWNIAKDFITGIHSAAGHFRAHCGHGIETGTSFN